LTNYYITTNRWSMRKSFFGWRRPCKTYFRISASYLQREFICCL